MSNPYLDLTAELNRGRLRALPFVPALGGEKSE